MGQIKTLLDNLFEIEETIYLQDMDMEYELWLKQKEQEQLAYEELLNDIK